MSRSFACIISGEASRDREILTAVAGQFAHSIEIIEDGILFDVSGLERLFGKPEHIAQKIVAELKLNNVPGSVAVAKTLRTATLLARQKSDQDQTVHSPDKFQQLPLLDLDIERDTLNVFRDLGIRNIADLLAISRSDLIGRYGHGFESVIDTIEQKAASLLTPNVKEDRVSWNFDLDASVENFEQLTFVLNHGLGRLFEQVEHCGFSTEHLDILFKLKNKTEKAYHIKTSFPSLERAFWLKLINLRASLDPPGAEIVSVNVIAHFTRPRPSQRGLYAVSRPEPESLLLTMNKLKKLVGEENVGTPGLLDQRQSQPFALAADKLPTGKETLDKARSDPIIAFSYFSPPLRAEVLVRDGRLVFITTQYFSGHVIEYSGVWKANSKWWDRSWKTQEWDVEVENNGVYRLCKLNKEWFLAGEYD